MDRAETAEIKTDEEEEFHEAAVADLVAQYKREREKAQAAEEQATAEDTNARFVQGRVKDVEPTPTPDQSSSVEELVEDGYEPRRLQITVAGGDGTEYEVSKRWSSAQDILSWYGDGRICSLVNETVILDTDGSTSIALPSNTNLHTSRAYHRAKMGLHTRLGLNETVTGYTVGVLSLLLAVVWGVAAAAMPFLYPTNPPVFAVLITLSGLVGAPALVIYAYKHGIFGAVANWLRELNRVD